MEEGHGLEDAGEALVDYWVVGHSGHTKVEWGASSLFVSAGWIFTDKISRDLANHIEDV